MVSKKGYIKTLEAVIAIIIIIVVSYTLIPLHAETPPEPPLAVQNAMSFINEKIEYDESLREAIVREREVEEDLAELIIKHKPKNYDFTCAVCPDTNCFIDPLVTFKKSIYVNDVFIASSKKEQKPKIVRIWFFASPITEADFITNSDTLANFKDTYLNKCMQKS